MCGGMAAEGAAVIFEMKGLCKDMMFGTRNGRRLKVKCTHTEEIKITAPYIPGRALSVWDACRQVSPLDAY